MLDNVTDLESYEQGKLIYQDIYDEVLRQIENFENPFRLIISAPTHNQLILFLEKREHVDIRSLALIKFSNLERQLEVILVNSKREFFYVTSHNEEEINKFYTEKSLQNS